MPQTQTKISKFLSYILRHNPGAVGLTLDPEGWVLIDDLLSKVEGKFTKADLLAVVANNDKQRFAISADGLSIRANQGHSLAVNLGLEAIAPPEYLYHGTASRFVSSIREQGLIPKNRQYVHLSADHTTAVTVGTRHGKPVVLCIYAQQMHAQGYEFFQADNGVWLTKQVPPGFLE